MPDIVAEHVIYKIEIDENIDVSFDAWDRRLKDFGSGFGMMGGLVGDVLQDVAQSTFDFAKDSSQAFGDFQQGMQEIAKTSGATGQVLDEIGNKLRDAVTVDLKGTTTISQLQEIAAQSAKFGIAAQNLDTFAVSTAKMASLWDLSVTKTGESAAKLISQYKLQQDELENVGSAIDAVADSFATSESYLLSFAQRTSGVAKQTGQSLADIAAIAARIATETGMGAEAASSAYSKVLNKIQANAPIFAKALGGPIEEWTELINTDGAEAFNFLIEKLEHVRDTKGPEAYVQTVKSLFGENVRVNQLLSGMIGTIEGNRDAMELANKAFEEGTRVSENFAASLETQNADMAQVKAQWHDFSISVGEALAPALSEILKLLQAHIMPRLKDFGKWLADSGKWMANLSDIWGEFWIEMADEMEAGKKIFGLFVDLVKTLWDVAKPGLTAFSEAITYMIEQIAEMENLWDVITGTIKIFANTAKKAIEGVIGVVGSLISKLWEATKAVTGLGKESHGESVFPDMYRWILRDIDSIQSLAQNVNTATQHVARLGQAMTVTTGGMGGQQSSTPSLRPGSLAPRPARVTPTTSPATVNAPVQVTNVFQGTNIVDESSKDRFAREIVKRGSQLRSHVVYA